MRGQSLVAMPAGAGGQLAEGDGMNAVIVAGEEAGGIAAAIRLEHEAASAAAGAAVAHAMEAGRLLAEARKGIPHGGWESFVRDRCGIAPRTARLYLQLDARRDRIANRQRDAGLTLREAARLVAEPRVKAKPQERFDFLGPWWATLDCVSVVFNPDWKFVPLPSCVDIAMDLFCASLSPPSWYSPGLCHDAEHHDGWSFAVMPDLFTPDRVNVFVHDPAETVHFATFDAVSPAAIEPFLTACERHGGMPSQDVGWTIRAAPMPKAITLPRRPVFQTIFDLAWRRGHRCHCWALIDGALGLTPVEGDPGFAAWKLFGRALGAYRPADISALSREIPLRPRREGARA